MNRPLVRCIAGGVFAVAVSALLAFGWPAPRGTFEPAGGDVAPGELVVQFRADVPVEQQEAVLSAHGATFDHSMLVSGYAMASVPPGSEQAIGEALAQSGVIATAADNPVREVASVPDDPYYAQQWNMPMIGLNTARDQSDGSGVTVAVIDTGVAYENFHDPVSGKDFAQAPDLADTTIVSPCDMFVTPPPNPFTCIDTHANDDYGHGTHVTGTIAQNTDNGLGAAGIAPKAKIMPVKVCGPTGNPSYEGCADDKTADGIEYAVQNGADIINLSIAGGEPVAQTAPLRQALTDARNAGVIVVAASGNGGADHIGNSVLDYPAAISGVVAVGAVGLLENRSGYSNYGVGETENGVEHDLDLVAPGGDTVAEGGLSVIWQQTYSSCTGATNFTTLPDATKCQGTSMAAAHVTGVAALIESKFPKLSATQVRNTLKCSAEDLGNPGVDQQYGAGLVRADKALIDTDHDNLPDCIDPAVVTPTPVPTPFQTPIPPPNDCLPGSSFTPSPTASLPPTPVNTGPTPTSRGTQTLGPSIAQVQGSPITDTPTPAPTDSPTPTDTPLPTDTPTPTATPLASETPTPTERVGSATPEPTPTDTPTPEPTTTVTPRPFRCGDVDCSGFINAGDALELLLWLTESQQVSCIGLGYVNCDGQLNVVDAAIILRHSATLPLNLPADCSGIDG
ncbi:MAG: S8 family serine peptidase [Chloroflexota bacterium]